MIFIVYKSFGNGINMFVTKFCHIVTVCHFFFVTQNIEKKYRKKRLSVTVLSFGGCSGFFKKRAFLLKKNFVTFLNVHFVTRKVEHVFIFF